MTSLVHPSSAWKSPPKIVLALAFLASQVAAQAAAPQPPASPHHSRPAIASPELGKIPHKHRETKRARVKPEKHATKGQQPVRSLR